MLASQHRPSIVASVKPVLDAVNNAWMGQTAEDLMQPAKALDESATGAEILAYFSATNSPESVAVLRSGYLLGVVRKVAFIKAYNECDTPDHFSTLPWSIWSTPSPLIADVGEDVEALASRATASEGADLPDTFIVTRGGRYAGLGSGVALRSVQCMLEARREHQKLALVELQLPLQRHFEFSARAQLRQLAGNHGLLHQPRETVSGDGVCLRHFDTGTLIAVVCCVQQGQPCAATQISSMSWLDAQLSSLPADTRLVDPGSLIARLHQFVQSHPNTGLHQGLRVVSVDRSARVDADGVMASVVWLPKHRSSLVFAGACMGLSLVRVNSKDIRNFSGNLFLAGSPSTPDNAVWESQVITLDGSFRALVCTPGLLRQIGGPFNEPLGQGVLNHFLKRHSALAPASIAKVLDGQLSSWQGDNAQQSDITALVFAAGQLDLGHTAQPSSRTAC